MKPWPFYGRKKEVTTLQNGLDLAKAKNIRLFQALRVRGKRGVGKTQLLYEMQKHAPTDGPIIINQLPDPVQYQNPVVELTSRVMKEASRIGGGDIKVRLQNLLSHRGEWDTDRMFFMEVLKALLKAGAVVVLDEFHLGQGLGLPGDVRQVIDEAARSRENFPGKLVMMGSHQQKFDDMFSADQPLHGRVDDTVLLQPWCLKTIMTMADEQGILASPDKFLTLWTAYGGMPRHWERYCRQNRYAHLHGIENDKDWRQAWLAVEHGVVANDGRERWHAKAWVELPKDHRFLLIWIGQNKPKGVKLNQIPKELGSYNEKLSIMNDLRDWTGLVELNRPLGEQSPAKWYITDPNTLFQINVFREMVPIKDDQPAVSVSGTVLGPSDGPRFLARMETLEGDSLEQLATAWLAAKEGVTWSGSRVWHPRFDSDIDSMATSMGDGPKVVWLGSCKRSEVSHSPTETRTKQDIFMECLIKSAGQEKEESAELLLKAELKRLLISPSFSPGYRERFGKEGFEIVDIPAMALSFDLHSH